MGEKSEALAKRLADEGPALAAQWAGLTEEQWARPVYLDGATWTARDVLAHLISAEQGHQRLIASVAGGGPGSPADFDLDGYNARGVAALADRSAAELLADFGRVRQATVALVAELADADLARRGRHPALGEAALLEDFIKIVYMHGKLHWRDLRRAFGACDGKTCPSA
jgi:uncharacterized protein (TIGR03083 family)